MLVSKLGINTNLKTIHLKVNAARFKEEVINMNTESVTEARKRNTE